MARKALNTLMEEFEHARTGIGVFMILYAIDYTLLNGESYYEQLPILGLSVLLL